MGNEGSADRPAYDVRKVLGWGAFSVLLSLACLSVIFRLTGDEGSLESLLKVGFGTLLGAVGLVVASWVMDGWRLAVMASAMGGKVSLLWAIKVSVMGSFMAGVTPFDTGGEPLKVFCLHKKGMSIGQSTATIALCAALHATTRLFLWALVPAVALVCGISWHPGVPVKFILFFGLLVYVFAIAALIASALWPSLVVRVAEWVCNLRVCRRLFSPESREKAMDKVRSAAEDFRQGVIRFRSSKGSMLFALGLSLAYWILALAVPALILKGVGAQLTPFQVFSLSMTVYLVMAFIPTPGASGGAEVGSALFFSSVLPGKILGTFVVVWRAVTYYLTLVVGGLLMAFEAASWSRNI